MAIGVVADSTVSLLEKGLDVASARHRAISANIANADTPGYKRKDVPFEVVMRRAIDGLDAADAGGGGRFLPVERLAEVGGRTVHRNDGNSVDIDYEMTLLAQNSILYAAMARQLSARLAMMRTAITEGRR